MKNFLLQLLFVLFACIALGQKKQKQTDLYKDSYNLINQSYNLLNEYRDSAIIIDTLSIKKIKENFDKFDKQIYLVDSALQKCLPTSKVTYKKLKRAKKDLISHRRNHLRYFKKKVRYIDEIDKVSAVCPLVLFYV